MGCRRGDRAGSLRADATARRGARPGVHLRLVASARAGRDAHRRVSARQGARCARCPRGRQPGAGIGDVTARRDRRRHDRRGGDGPRGRPATDRRRDRRRHARHRSADDRRRRRQGERDPTSARDRAAHVGAARPMLRHARRRARRRGAPGRGHHRHRPATTVGRVPAGQRPGAALPHVPGRVSEPVPRRRARRPVSRRVRRVADPLGPGCRRRPPSRSLCDVPDPRFVDRRARRPGGGARRRCCRVLESTVRAGPLGVPARRAPGVRCVARERPLERGDLPRVPEGAGGADVGTADLRPVLPPGEHAGTTGGGAPRADPSPGRERSARAGAALETIHCGPALAPPFALDPQWIESTFGVRLGADPTVLS